MPQYLFQSVTKAPIPLLPTPIEDLAGFRLLRPLGLPGSFGTVFEAERDGLRYALKVFHAPLLTEKQEERFRSEVCVLQQVSHVNIVPYADSGIASFVGRHLPWIAMPYVKGRSLLEEIADAGGSLPIARVRYVSRQIAAGLAALHEHNIVHRDLKPANVLVGDDDVVRLLDFGVSRFLDRTTITSRGDLMGSPAYASPEQIRGDADLATDLWAVGIVMYELLAGRRPFDGDDLGALIDAIRDEQPEPPSAHRSDVPEDLDRLVLDLLAKEPMQRPYAADQLADALKPNVQVVSGGPEPLPDGGEPLIFLRVGRRDADAAMNACLGGDSPTGLVATISERTAAVTARKAAQLHDLSFAVDPLVWRMSSSNFSRTKSLRQLPYAPDGPDSLAPRRPPLIASRPSSRPRSRRRPGRLRRQRPVRCQFLLRRSRRSLA